MKKSLLIADDDPDVVELLTRRCQTLGIEVDSANSAISALSKIEEDVPDLVILDVDMPHGDGLSVCEMMSGHEELRLIPVVMLTSSSSEETIRRCHRLCAYYVLKCPDLWPRVEPLLYELLDLDEATKGSSSEESEAEHPVEAVDGCTSTELLDTVFAVLGVEKEHSLLEDESSGQAPRSDGAWVLSIEDDDDVAMALRLRLQEYGVQVIRAAAGTEGYRRAFVEAPRAIILDYELPEGNGDYVLRRLKESPATSDIPVIVLTGRREANIERKMRNLGAAEFLTKPLDWTRLRATLQNILDTYQAPCDTERLEQTIA